MVHTPKLNCKIQVFDPHRIAVSGISDLAPYEPGLPLEEIERKYGITNAVKLASNENPLGPSPLAQEILNRGLDVSMYPDGSGWRLTHALAEFHDVEANQITLGNGSNEVLDLVARVFVNPGDSGVISEHSFVVFRLALAYVQAELKIVEAVDYGHDLDAMAKAVDDRTKIMYIANPNNPTGTWSRSSELKKLMETVPENVIVLVDEAYSEYCTDPEYPNCIKWLDTYPNLVVSRTFSKIFGLAGLRIGYSVSSSKIADLMNRVRAPFNTNSIGQAAALASLKDKEHAKKSCMLNQSQMKVLHTGLQKLGFKTSGTAGNFVVVEINEPVSNAWEKLLKRGVIVRPLTSYGMPNHFRVTVGTSSQNARALKEFQILA